MSDFYIYIDETGSCDYSPESGPRFAIGSVVFEGDHSAAIWAGLQLRVDFERRGVHLPKGFHAVEDARRTRAEVFGLISQHPPLRFDSTFLTKARAYPYIVAKGKPYLYQMALYQHLKHLIPLVAPRDAGHRVFVIAGTIHLTKGTVAAARKALTDVCEQLSGPQRTVVSCLWEARSSWGIQVADYCAWALQRDMEQKPCEWYPTVVGPLLASNYGPWN